MTHRVAVLGAGPMGLAAAYQLARNGIKPVIFEADDRVGGMSASFDFNGLNIERFYHFHCTSDDDVFTVLKELGLTSKLHWVKTTMGYWYQGQVQDWGNPLALLFFRGLSLEAKFRYGLHAFCSIKRNDPKRLEQKDAQAWVRQWVGEEAYEILWRRLFEYKFYDYSQDLSAAWIWTRIRRLGQSRYNLFQEKLGYIDGGSSTLLDAMVKDIAAHGGELHLNSPVQQVEVVNGQVKRLLSSGTWEAFDRVISTIPLPYIPQIIPGLPQNILRQYEAVKSIACVCVIAKVRKAVTSHFWLNTSDPAMDIPGVVEYSNLRPLQEHVVYAPFYLPAEHPKFSETDQAFKDKVRGYLRRINPHLTDDDFLDIQVNRYRHAQPICTRNYLDKIPPAALPIKGLWIADTSYYYPEDRGIAESVRFGRALAAQASR